MNPLAVREYKIFTVLKKKRRSGLSENSRVGGDLMLDARALIEKHRLKGVLVDTNLLVLLLVGSVNKRRILNFKRTQNFAIEVFDLLSRLIRWFGKLVTTPHVFSQVSDLTDLPGKDLRTGPKRTGFARRVHRGII